MGALSLFTLIMSIATGERINFLIRACGGMLAGLVWRPNWRRYLALIIVEVIAVIAISASSPGTTERYVDHFLDQLPTGVHSAYYRTMAPGFIAFEQAPILGIGTANYRDQCADILIGGSAFRCDNHPHNFYIQMLAETGILGFAAGLFMISAMLISLFRAGRANSQNVVAATAYVVPLGLFFPLQSTADFFGQWNNIFLWSAVALSVATVNLRTEQGSS